MNRPVTVVVFYSLSYSGTTWINTLLGCHERAFALVSADRAIDAMKEKPRLQYNDDGWRRICNVHYEDCDFWPRFQQQYDPAGNLFLQLAETTGKDVIIINNPVDGIATEHLNHRDVIVKRINWIRDGRSIAASYQRQFPLKDFADVINFMTPAMKAIPYDPDNTEQLSLRYEDAMSERLAALTQIGHFIGLDYAEQALEFWSYPHHMTGGNPSIYQLIRDGQGMSVMDWIDKDYYAGRFRDIRESGGRRFEPDRWRRELSRGNLFMYDVYCGADNARYGYERDAFTFEEFCEYSRALASIASKITAPVPGEFSKLRDLDVVHSAVPRVAARNIRQSLNRTQLRRSGFYLSPAQLRKLVRLFLAIVLFATVAGILLSMVM